MELFPSCFLELSMQWRWLFEIVDFMCPRWASNSLYNWRWFSVSKWCFLAYLLRIGTKLQKQSNCSEPARCIQEYKPSGSQKTKCNTTLPFIIVCANHTAMMRPRSYSSNMHGTTGEALQQANKTIRPELSQCNASRICSHTKNVRHWLKGVSNHPKQSLQ